MSKNSKQKRAAKLKIKKVKRSKLIAVRESNKNKIATIYLDESGNTGSNLVDKNQPIFTLASCRLTVQEANRLLSLVGSKSPKEAHFKSLKRRQSGQDGVIRLLKHSLINSDNVRVELINKNFMITTKIVDLLIENMTHLQGFDLYKNGANIALSNMWYFCFPAFCGEEAVENMYAKFVKMIKEQSEDAISEYYTSVESLKEVTSEKDFIEDLNMILASKSFIDDILTGIDKSALDPALPTLFCHCVHWGEVHPKGFHIIHDDSQTVEQQKEMYAKFSDWSQPEIELGYDRRKYKLPLKGRSLKFASSELYPQLQVADIIASSISYWAEKVGNGESEDRFFLELDKLNLDKLLTKNKIWPTTAVSPKELKTVHDGGLNPADHSAYFLMKSKANEAVLAS